MLEKTIIALEHLDRLTVFGIVAITLVLIFCAWENRSPLFVLAFIVTLVPFHQLWNGLSMISESGKLAGVAHTYKRADKYSGERLTFKSCPKEQRMLLTVCL
jgi:hypothetical protein